ncbi:MAG: T9SS type A sorting domain-containing protein [Bacteroidia bacterium]|nr:T9SS type A sorting domain-containing protein [Bacteroidia bacterium]MCF8427896.1 T9SS type A sorting domain-containing protein [Bacteroidia bacterium]
MKKIYLVFGMLGALISGTNAQSFSDNFDSYTSGAFLAASNSAWKTWSNKPGGSDDAKISSVKAKSGSNSVYFSSTAGTGGPQDIVLPFGGSELTSGTFELSMQIFVESQKKGYFNFQEQTTLGKGWSIDVNFDSLGKFNIVNTLNGTLLTGTYSTNQWVKVTVKINLNTNTWDFLLDDVSQGTFQNSYRKVASMDIYPTQNSSFYVDDVSYTYTPFTLPTLNGSITYIDKVLGKLSGQQVIPQVEIRNLGTTAITSAKIEVSYNGSTLSKTVSGLNLASNATRVITMDGSLLLVSGNHNITANLLEVNGSADDNSTDNTKSISITPLVPAIGKVVVAEEATGTWCQWCPRGAVWLKNMDEKYHGYVIGIAVHNNDPMTNANYDGGLKTKISGYPSMVVDRGADIDPSGMETDFLERIVVAPKGGIRNGAEYNATTRELKVSLITKFNTAVTGNYKLAFVLTEDDVTGTTNGYNQSNAYAGGGNGVMGGYETLPNPVPAAQMVYDHVGRIIYPNFSGLNNAFGSTINANDSFIHNFSLTIDPTWNVGNLHVVGLLIDPSGRIDNGSSVSLEEAIINGYVSGSTVLSVNKNTSLQNGVQLYPNPGKNYFGLILPAEVKGSAELVVYSAEGKQVHQETLTNSNNQINTSEWPAGIYFGSIQSNQGTMHIKWIKE